ncbi:Peptidoglycan-binding (PGRP) domain of peptidoglycan hydrolases-containing protein [Amycolatopsis arida]|uniref:Peptidoglycan-binding (PGRP) domain of peptidoglycan hydrolases-containing protein n=1 Tax=Amycolatopsis arida TaxID=587909 RepID=A0A1I5SJX7_9PSEU|nr:peptidoglycan-binding protein [Amycolatopsis arida]TDX96460.1 peptidoglycan hydrolase-like protein with peptidoglycan-binding domain [Amycolatopsis arida]SFP70807.1 Peptidoglycan-binding (PGRP) domain of peptidoglycan hydrolases-containing protein [Amycolatopsis arida]
MRATLVKLAVGLLLAGGATALSTAPASAAEPPTGSQLSTAVKDCTKQISSGRYAERSGGTRTVPVCATGNAVHWRSGMTIDCDGQRTPKCNPSTDPWWQSGTAWPQSDGKPLNAEKLPFVVVPISSSIWDHFRSNITGGTVAAVVYQGRVVYAVVGDRGPKDAIGEGSYALAKALGINPDPRSGGVSGKVVDYIVFPEVKANPIENHADAVRKGEQAAADLVAGRKGCLSVRLNFTSYGTLDAGATGNQVTAAQCLLRAAGHGTGEGDPTGTLDEATVAAVKQFQVKVGLPASGSVDSRTWTALLSRGGTPQVQDGSSGDAVVRVQRSLNAAVGAGLNVDGLFGPKTTAAVKQYQSSRGLAADGIVGPNTWKALQSGR